MASSLTIDDAMASLEWVVSNIGREAVYFRAHPDDGRREEVMEGKAYSWLSPDEQELHLTFLNPPPDPSVDVERAIISLSRHLAPGDRYRARIEVPLPVPEWNPYFPALADGTKLVDVTRVRLTTGWFPESGLAWSGDGPGPGTYWAQGRPYRLVENRMTAQRAFAVRKRLDDFRRV